MGLFTIMRGLGFPMKKASQIMDSIPEGDDFSTWHNQKKWDAFFFHYNNNTSYRNFVGKVPKHWNEIPIIKKQDFKNNNIALKPQKNGFKSYYKQSTSGSTGIPFTFFSDYLSHALTWTFIDKIYAQADAPLNSLQARFYGIPTDFWGRIKEKTKDFLANRQRFQVINLSGKNINNWLRMMKNRKFSYLYGYAFPLIIFAKHLDSQNKTLKKIVPSIKSCIVTSEMCTLEEQKLMEKAFGVKVFNEYGASEIGIIGFGDTGKWRVSEEMMHVEIVDEHGQQVEDGKVGRVICTPLFQKGTPFIRYDTGDLAAIQTIKGKRYITELQGRKEAVLKMPSGESIPGDTLFHFVIKEFNRKFPNTIHQFQAIQKNDLSVEISIVSENPLSKSEEKLLKKYINKYIHKEIGVEIRHVFEISHHGRAKQQRFISRIEQ